MAKKIPTPRKGTILRPALDNDDEFRSVIAIGGNSAATSVADGATATLTFSSAQEEGFVDRLILQGGAAVSLVAGAEAGLTGCTVSSFKCGQNDELISNGYVPARLFEAVSVHNPKIGKYIKNNDAIVVQVVNNSGATMELTAGCTMY